MIRKVALGVLAVLLFGRPLSAQTGTPQTNTQQQDLASQIVPAYHKEPSKEPLPKTLNPDGFEDPLVTNVYAMAAKIEGVLYQQPCYCRCDQTDHHASLLDCFVDHHGAGCDICQREAIFAYVETKKGKSASEIRDEIMNGDYSHIDLDEYRSPVKVD